MASTAKTFNNNNNTNTNTSNSSNEVEQLRRENETLRRTLKAFQDKRYILNGFTDATHTHNAQPQSNSSSQSNSQSSSSSSSQSNSSMLKIHSHGVKLVASSATPAAISDAMNSHIDQSNNKSNNNGNSGDGSDDINDNYYKSGGLGSIGEFVSPSNNSNISEGENGAAALNDVDSNNNDTSEEHKCTQRQYPRMTALDLQKSLSTAEGTRDLYQQLQNHIESPQFLAFLESRNGVFVVDKDTQDSVGFVDVDNVDWWTILPGGSDKITPNDTFEDTDPLDGPYILVEESDVIESISEFVAIYLYQFPSTRKLSHQELQKVLAGTFHDLREKGRIQRLWDWGKFLYTTYGWGAMTISIYRDPSVAMAVLRAVYTISKWLIVAALA